MAQLFCLSKGGHDALNLPHYAVESPDLDTSDDEDEDEDRFFAGLTRRLTQSKSFPGVPSRRLAAPPYLIEENRESTLAGSRNWLTPMTISQLRVPFQYETERFDVAIRAAALELTNLNMAPQHLQLQFGTRYAEKRDSPFPLPPDHDRLPWTQNQNHDPFSLPVAPTPLQRRHAGDSEVTNQCHRALLMSQQRKAPQQQICSQIGRSGYVDGSRLGRTNNFPEPGWASKVVPYGIGSVPKRGCAGTGVFLPRGYGDVTLESRRKSGCSTPSVIVPAKVGRALNMNVHLQDQGGLLLARRNALLMQQRRLSADGPLNHHEPCLLPQEWTY